MMFCSKCGAQNVDGAKFCSRCGIDLSTLTPNPIPPPTTPPPTPEYPTDTIDAARTVTADALRPGRLIAGRYQIQEHLGSGGMGEVWRAVDNELDIEVAIKVVPPILARSRQAVDQLKREAGLALKLTHSSICRLYNFHSDGETKFLVMEYMRGRTLEAVLGEAPDRRLPWPRVRSILQQIGAALDFAHSLNPPILHMDIKPANIMIADDGRAHLMDFGIAREIRDSMTRITGREDTSGTVPYMSPEQFRGERVDSRSDLYSLCCVAYEALVGEPFVHSRGSLAWQVQEKVFIPIEGLPDEANRLLSAGLAKRAEDRPATVAALLDEAAEAKLQATPETPPLPPPPPPPPPKRQDRPAPPVKPKPQRKAPADSSAAPPRREPPPVLPPPVPSQPIFKTLLVGFISRVIPPIAIIRTVVNLRRHMVSRASAPLLGSPRFDNEAGRAISARLASAAGPPGRHVIRTPLLISIVLAVIPWAIAVVVAAAGPAPADFDYCFEKVLEGSDTLYLYVYSPEEFEDMIWDLEGYDISVSYSSVSPQSTEPSKGGKFAGPTAFDPSLPRWESENPYESIYNPTELSYYIVRTSQGYDVELMQISSIRLRWPEAAMGLVAFLAFQFLLLLYWSVLFIRMALRFLRHREAEIEAAILGGDERGPTHETLAKVRSSNARLAVATFILGLTPLYLILLWLVGPTLVARHVRHDHQRGVETVFAEAE